MTVAAATSTTAFRGRVLQFLADPADAGERAHVFDEDGVLVVRDGRVVASGDWGAIRNSLVATATDRPRSRSSATSCASTLRQPAVVPGETTSTSVSLAGGGKAEKMLLLP